MGNEAPRASARLLTSASPLSLARSHPARPPYPPDHPGGRLRCQSTHLPPCFVDSHTPFMSQPPGHLPAPRRDWGHATHATPLLPCDSHALATIMHHVLSWLVLSPSRAGLAWLPLHEIPRTSTTNREHGRHSVITTDWMRAWLNDRPRLTYSAHFTSHRPRVQDNPAPILQIGKVWHRAGEAAQSLMLAMSGRAGTPCLSDFKAYVLSPGTRPVEGRAENSNHSRRAPWARPRVHFCSG